jgi:hypothetical protein
MKKAEGREGASACVHQSRAERGTREGENDEDQERKTSYGHRWGVARLSEVVQD